MSENTVITAEEKSNNAETIIKQLDALRKALDAIEEKVDPAPVRYPDTFEQSKVWAGAYRDLCERFRNQCERFWGDVLYFSDHMSGSRNIHYAISNRSAWESVVERLERAFKDQAQSLFNQLQALATYGEHLTMLAALMCNGDLGEMEKAVAEELKLYQYGQRIDPNAQRGHTVAEV